MKFISTTLAVMAALLLSAAPEAAEAADDLRAALENPGRAEADKARDAGRKPADVVEFLGIGEGMVVLDLMAGAGYYSEVLSYAVGPTGTVYAHNTPGGLRFRDGANDKAMNARLADERLPNVERKDGDFSEMGIRTGALDAAFTALNMHDIYNASPETAEGLLAVIRALLKPGGILGIVDHAGVAGADNAALHRVEEEKILEIASSAGFELVSTSDLLANPDDDGSAGIFGADMRGNTDRFLLKFSRSEAP